LNTPCIRVKNLDLVFGNHPKSAFQRMDQKESREKILKETGQIVANQDISFEVYSGEIFVLMGLSGSGKSSLLRCVNGMNGRGKGTVRGSLEFRDQITGEWIDLFRCSESQLRILRRNQNAMVFQGFGLMPWLTVLENVEYPLRLQGTPLKERVQRAREQLEIVGLKAWEDYYPEELSGGMQQRVGLARALVTPAEVLLMDEPFSALDPFYRKQLQEEVLFLQHKFKKTVLFVTHDWIEAARLANRIALLDSGRILQIGTPQEIQNNPNCARVKSFIDSAGPFGGPSEVSQKPVPESVESHSLWKELDDLDRIGLTAGRAEPTHKSQYLPAEPHQ
jgi:glycine betaine/proline transport system ATP-binding protein